MKTVDLNSDLGESFGAYTIGCDSEVLKFISSANIACGFHAGDPKVMLKTIKTALACGIVTADGNLLTFHDFQVYRLGHPPRRITHYSVYNLYHLSQRPGLCVQIISYPVFLPVPSS